MHQLKTYIILFVIFIAVILYYLSTPGPILETGGNFENLAEFENQVSQNNFVILGRFNISWPARIEQISQAENEISLEIPGHGKHTYPGYTGYRLKSVLLKRSDGQFMGFVLRSKDKF